MYQYVEDPNQHAMRFYQHLVDAIESINTESTQAQLASQKAYADIFYNWEPRSRQWNALLNAMVELPRAFPEEEKKMFQYSVNI